MRADAVLDSAPVGRHVQVNVTRGERLVQDGEPTADEVAALLRRIAGAGTVARLDMVQAALLEAYRRGRTAERTEVAQLAESHVATFQAALQQRAKAQAAHAALPWYLQ